MGWPMRVSGNGWTENDVALLRELAAQNLFAIEIGAALGRTKNAVISKCRSTGTPLAGNAPPTPEEVQQRIEKHRERARKLARRKRGLMAATRPAKAPRPPKKPPAPRATQRVASVLLFASAKAPQALNVPLLETESFHCRWITSQDHAPATCCGHQTVDDGSWCAYHIARVFTFTPALSPKRKSMGGYIAAPFSNRDYNVVGMVREIPFS
jgi:hypothetical protein